MSELVKKLEQTVRGGTRSIGFGPAKKEKVPPMIVIALVSGMDEEAARLAIDGKADLMLFDIKDPAGQAYTLDGLASSHGRLPWGARLHKTEKDGIRRLREAGCDFVTLNGEVAAHILEEENIGKVLELESSIEDSLLRAVGRLGADALLLDVGKTAGALTVNQTLGYHRLAGFGGKTSLAFAPHQISDLAIMRDVGIRGVVLDMSGKDGEERLKELIEAVQKLPPAPGKKARDHGHALLPAVSVSQDQDDEDEF